MRYLFGIPFMCLVSVAWLYGQQRPTLGPATPSLRGPSIPRTTNRRRLLRIRKIYIAPIDNNLSDKLTNDFANLRWLQIVDKPQKADAILRGTCLDSRHLKQVHSEVFITDRATGDSIWQDVVRVPYNPPSLQDAVDSTAADILEHLVRSVRQAGNR